MIRNTKVPARRSSSRSKLALPVDVDRIVSWAVTLLDVGTAIGLETVADCLRDPKVWTGLAKAVATKDAAAAAKLLWPLVRKAAKTAIRERGKTC